MLLQRTLCTSVLYVLEGGSSLLKVHPSTCPLVLQVGAAIVTSRFSAIHEAIRHNQPGQLSQLLQYMQVFRPTQNVIRRVPCPVLFPCCSSRTKVAGFVNQMRQLAKAVVADAVSGAFQRLNLRGISDNDQMPFSDEKLIPTEITLLDNDGRTAISLSVHLRHTECTSVLLSCAASDVLQTLRTYDADGATPLHHAVAQHDPELVGAMLSAIPPSARWEVLSAPRREAVEVTSFDSGRKEHLSNLKLIGSSPDAANIYAEQGRQLSRSMEESRQPVPTTCPILIAAGLMSSAVLEEIMRNLPQVWQKDEELPLLQAIQGPNHLLPFFFAFSLE